MKRKEYMEQLTYLLQDISPEELKEVLDYYEGYFDEAGSDHEEDVIEELGSPEKTAAIIRDSLQGENGEPEYTEQGYYNSRYDDHTKMPERFDSQEEAKADQESSHRQSGFHFKGDRNRNLALVILICFGAVCVGVPLAGGVAAGAVGLFAGFVGLVTGIFGATVGMILGGIGVFVAGITKMFVSVPVGILYLGTGMVMIGLGFLFLMLFVWIVSDVIPPLIRTIVGWIRKMFHMGGAQS